MRYVRHQRPNNPMLENYEKIVAPYILDDADVYRKLGQFSDQVRIVLCAPGDFEQIEQCVLTHVRSVYVRRKVRGSTLVRMGCYIALGYGGRTVEERGRWTEKNAEYSKQQSVGGTASAVTEENTLRTPCVDAAVITNEG